MADFDKDLQPIIKPSGYKATNIPIGPGMNFSTPGGGGVSDLSQKEDIYSELAAAGQKFSQKGLFISNAELEANKRYKTFNPTIGDYEDFAAQGQEWYKQATNGVLKGANLAATTIAGGFGMLYGVGKAVLFTQKLSDVWDNEINRGLQKWNEKVDNEYLPNYYTAAERNAEWYSTDNWFTTNFLFDKLIKNSGYAVGAMVGGNIANTSLLKLGSTLGNALAKGATAAEASQAFKLFTPLLRNTSRAFSAGKNKEAAALLESKISSIADLSAKASQMANISKQTGQFARFSDSARRTAVATYSSAGEASFEALHTAKEYRDNLIDEYTRKNGYEPTGEELKNIDLQAEKVGKTSFFGNMALLSITEFNQLPYLIGSSYGPSRQAINSLLGRVDNAAVDDALKGIKAAPKTKFGKIYEGTKRAGVYVFDPKESMQEVLQYGLQVGTQNYFKKSEQGGEADLFVDGFLYGLFGKDKFGEGVGAFVSKEGIEGGILGGITGAVMQARGNYQERKALAKNTENFLNMLENAPTFKEAFQDKLDGTNRGVVLQQQERDAILNGDKLEAIDLRVDGIHNYLAPRIKYGRFDMVMDDLNELKQSGMTESGLAELKEQGMANINDDVNSFQKRITSIENAAKNLNDMYQSLNIRYAGETIEVDGEERRKYSPITIDKLAYAASKIANYDVRIPQLNGNLINAGINTQSILNDIIATGTPNTEATKEALEAINSMNVTSDVKDELKGQLDDVIELSLRRKMFIEEYDSIKNTPLNYERPKEEVDNVDVLQKEGRKKLQKTLEVGKEYSLTDPISLEKGKLILAPKFTVLSSTLGGEFEVLLPDGTTTFFSPDQFNKYSLTEETNTSQEMEDALNQAIDEVFGYPAFRNVLKRPEEGVNKLAYVNSLGNQKFTKAIINRFNKLTEALREAKAKEKEAVDKLKEQKEDIDKQQNDVANQPGDPSVDEIQFDTRIDSGETGPLKTAAKFFNSSSNESDDPNYKFYNPNPAPHIIRSRVFLNNAKNNKKRDKFRAITFTYNQENDLGLSGITELSYGKNWEANKNKVNDLINGFVAQVYVEVEGKNRYFIDKNGDRIKNAQGQDIKVGEQVDLSKVIFETRPTAVEYSSADGDRFRTNEKDEFLRNMEIWKRQREILLGNPAKNIAPMAAKDLPTNSFIISKGFAITTPKVDGKYVKNKVGDTIVQESQIGTQPGLLKISTGDNIIHSGETMKAKLGLVYLQFRDTLQVLNNNVLGAKKGKVVYEVIKSLINDMQSQALSGKPVSLDRQKLLYLRSVLNYAKPTAEMASNQLWIDIESMSVKLGDKSFSFSDFINKEAESVSALANTYHAANKRTLDKGQSYLEFVFEDGKLSTVKWPNYQSYLISGKNRNIDDIPFVTNVAKTSDAIPYNFRGKYATVQNFSVGEKNTDFNDPTQQQAPSSTDIQAQIDALEKAKKKELIETSIADGNGISYPDSEIAINIRKRYDDKIAELRAKIKPQQPPAPPVGKSEANSASDPPPSLPAMKIGNFNINDGSTNTVQVGSQKVNTIIDKGEIVDGKLFIEVSFDFDDPVNQTAVQNIQNNPAFKSTYFASWKSALPELNDDSTEEETIGAYFRNQIKSQLLDAFNAQQAPPTAPVSDVEAKKADIERRRQEELESLFKKSVEENVDYYAENSGTTVSEYGTSKDFVESYISNRTFNKWLKEEGNDKDIDKPEVDKINAKYDAELAALEGKPVEEVKPSVEKTTPPPAEEPTSPPKSKKGRFKSGYDDARALSKGEAEAEKISQRDIEVFKAWHAKNAKTIPFEILDNIITLHDGRKAWGVFENGVAKFFKSGLRGTEYHEIFEGIWKGFLSENERQIILDEFKNKPGDFLDRESGRRILFSEATDRQAKERIADDFADYRVGKLPARNLSERIRRFFKAIVDFFKSFVNKPSLKDELFKAIDSGRFREAILPESVKVAQPEYRKEMVIADGSTLFEDEAYNFVQDMAISIAGYILNRENDNTVENVFEFKKVTGTQAYNFLRNKYTEVGNFEQIGEKVFNELYLRTVDQLRIMGISIDAESIKSINDGDGNNRLYSPEAFEVDFKKNMKFAIKFLISSLPAAEKSKLDKFGKPVLKKGAADLAVLSNFNRNFATLLSKLSDTSLEKIPEKLYELYKEDGNYYRLVRALRGDMSAENPESLFDFKSFKDNDWKLYIQFTQAFNKSKPNSFVESRNKSIDGISVVTKPAEKASAINVVKYNWLSNVKQLSTEGGSMIKREKLSYFIDVEHPNYPSKVPDSNEVGIAQRLEFLKNIGINFPASAIPRIVGEESTERNKFIKAVNDIYNYGSKNLADSGNFTNADGAVMKLAELYVNSLNPDHDTTRLNVENKRTGNYSDSNAVSVFEEIFNESKSIDELLQRRPELRDVYSKNSVILKKGGYFFDENGDKIEGRILKVGVVDGINENDGGTTITSLTKGERFTLEINQNLRGEYYILIPADSSTERTLNVGNNISFADTNTEAGDKEFFEIMKNYLNDEIELALDWRNRKQLAAVGETRAKQLRMFREILDKDLVDQIEKVVADGRLSKDGARKKIEKILKDNSSKIETSFKSTVEYLNNKLDGDLKNTGQVMNVSSEMVEYPYLDNDFIQDNKIDKNEMSIDDYNKLLSFINMNQMIASIEIHKFIFGDPSQFKTTAEGNLEATKRFKSWLSPRRKTFDSQAYNDFLNDDYNKTADGQDLPGDDITRYKFRSSVTTVTLTDPKPISRYIDRMKEYVDYEGYDESDGFSLIQIGAYREVKLKNAEWPKEAETWYQWQMAYTRQKLSGLKKADGKAAYSYGDNTWLKKHDEELIKKREPYYVLEVLKPIVSGAKPNLDRIEGDIDKYSQMPVFFKAVEGTALQDLYVQMLDQEVGYVVYKSGRKEGARGTHNLYKNGKINTDKFGEDTIEEIAWSTYGIQVDNTYEEDKNQTRVSQLMKNASMDMFENGKEVMPGAAKIVQEIESNHNEYHQLQYDEFLEKLGIKDLGTSFEIVDAKKVSETLEYELLRREASENTIDTIRLDEGGNFRIPFEASSAYEEIQRVLYSIINKSLISPSMEGKPYVQVPATGWENKEEGRELIRRIKTAEGFKYEQVNQKQFDAMSEEDKKTVYLASSKLKFYENEEGKRHMEVMIPNYWKKYFKGMTDEEVLKYLNKKENQKILFGVGARIPHQAMSSTEIFKVVGFLHPSMGSTIVVPSEIVKKAGSDFDIDKLNTYLKAVYLDADDNVKLVEYKGSKQATLDFYDKVFYDVASKEAEQILDSREFMDQLYEFFDVYEGVENASELEPYDLKLALGEEQFAFYAKFKKIITNTINRASEKGMSPLDHLNVSMAKSAGRFEKLTTKQIYDAMKDDFVKQMYKKSLENRYYELLQQLITLPENFSRLMTPVSDAGLPAVAKELDKARGEEEGSEKHKLLSKSFLTSLRHAFTLGKKWVGIVAVNITAHAIAQRINAYIDPSRLSKIDKYDASFLGDMSLVIPHNTITVDGEDKIALGGRNTAYSRKDKKGEPVIEFISDRLSGYASAVVDVAKDPFIMRILNSDLVVGIAMFMERIGTGELAPFFLNQPIIIDYLKYLDKIGNRALFSDTNITQMYEKYPISAGKSYDLRNDFPIDPETKLVDFEKSKASLLSSIDINAKKDEEFNLKQHAVFKEFLKVAKMAQFSFKFTQAYNYDTTRVRTTEGVLRKALRTDIAEEANIISSVNDVFKKTFIGKQREMIIKEVKSLSAIFKLDNDVFYNIIDEVLKPFASQEYMSLDDFDRVVKKVKTGMIDYLVQTKSPVFSKSIITSLISGQNNIGKQLSTLQKKYPESELLSNFETRFSKYEEGAVTVTMKAKPSDAATTNRYIAMMRELKALEPEFYNNLVLISLLQGTYDTRIAINKIVPLEDRAEIIAPLINATYSQADLQNFSRKGVFFRTNFSDNSIVPEYTPKFLVREGQFGYQRTGFIKLDGTDSTPGNGRVLRLSKAYSRFNNAEMDFLKVKRYQYAKGYIFDITGEKKPMLWKTEFKPLVQNGDVNQYEMVGYKKVKDSSGEPLTDEKDNVYFKMVNLYGDGDLVKLYRIDGLPSTIKNNTYPVKQELSDDTIIKAVNNEIISSPERIIEQPTEVSQQSSQVYSQLGNKTQSENIVISNIKTKDGKYDREANIKEAQENNRIYSMETNSNLSFSNPWASFKRGDTINTSTTKEAVQNYIDWLITDKFKDIKPERRAWILNQLKLGSLKGKTIQYYAELNEPSHATALDYLINKYDWSKSIVEQPTVEASQIAGQPRKEIQPGFFDYGLLSKDSVEGININTKSSDKLGRELTNPNWGAKNIMDIEAEYKANASKIKAPELTMDEALRYDMNLMYKLQMKKFKAHPELIQEITDRGGVKFLEASEHTVGVKGSRWEGKGTNSNFIKVLIKSYQDSLETTQPSTSVNPLIEAGIKPTDMYGNAGKDIQMASESTQFIGYKSGNATISSTDKYRNAWGNKANTGRYTSNDVVMVSGSGLFRGVTDAQIRQTFSEKYLPLLDAAISAGASFRVGNQYAKGNLSDRLIADYLQSNGYVEERLNGYSRWSKTIATTPEQVVPDTPIVETVLDTKVDNFRYYGAPYQIVLDTDGKPINVVGYRGSKSKMQAILDAYLENPNVDPQNKKPFRKESGEVIEEQPSTAKSKFTYKGTTIDTEFELTEGQRQALEKLIDFATDPSSKFITLQGAAGTGKTSVIGYLQKYLKSSTFNFFAPTHAATAELAFATVKTGNRMMPMTVASALNQAYDPVTNTTSAILTRKITDRLGLRNNVFVVDEVSMLNSKDYDALKSIIDNSKIKVIFMGDIMQIPEVDSQNPEKKLVSKAFTDHDQVILTEVKRTSSDSILNMLVNVRNNINDKIPLVEPSEELQYLPTSEFNEEIANVFEKDPEETVLINYRNVGVEGYNKKIRSVLGRVGELVPSDVIVGYLGYSSKQIDKGNIANSIRYTVQSVVKSGSVYRITASSKKLQALEDLGVSGVSGIATTNYMQLSRNDSFDFPNLTEEDFDKNNKTISNLMQQLKNAKDYALANKSKGLAWVRYYEAKDKVSGFFASHDLGGDYIYNPSSEQMEKYSNEIHKNIDKDMRVEKGIDFGHAITIHKSQGTTVKNVFFDANSLPSGSTSKLMMKGKQIGTEKHSLLYVGISRASQYLGIHYANMANFYTPEGVESSESGNLGFDSTLEFSEKEKTTIVSNFANKHKMTNQEARKYLNDAFAKSDTKSVIDKLKECYL